MTLRDQLFPEGEEHRHDGLLQMQWSEGWADAFLGLGALTHWMTPKLRELHAEVDYAGAMVVFLQRHRVELGLKTLLHYAGASAKNTHDLDSLWHACDAALKPEHPSNWDAFVRAHREFVQLVGAVDPASFAFRYPVDRSGAPVKRPIFVDPVVFESAGAAFEASVEAWGHYLLAAAGQG